MVDPPTFHNLEARTAPLLADAAEGVFDHAIDPDRLAAFRADPRHEMILAVALGRVVGMASGSELLHPDKPPAFFIAEVGVASAWRRRGIGANLCRRLIAHARARGCKGLWLATEADNVAARALYRRLGGRETAGIVVFDWDGAMDG
jgi:ribosomal protein S18 acetylase RimI-like enzyme